MKIKLYVNERGEFQADVFTPDGKRYHATSSEHPGRALVRLGVFWMEQDKPKDPAMQTLAQVLTGQFDAPQ